MHLSVPDGGNLPPPEPHTRSPCFFLAEQDPNTPVASYTKAQQQLGQAIDLFLMFTLHVNVLLFFHLTHEMSLAQSNHFLTAHTQLE